MSSARLNKDNIKFFSGNSNGSTDADDMVKMSITTNNQNQYVAGALKFTYGNHATTNKVKLLNIADGSNTNDAVNYGQMNNADTSLQTRISNEESARAGADTSLETRFSNADTSLQTRISNEESARASADTSLETRIDNVDTKMEALVSGTSWFEQVEYAFKQVHAIQNDYNHSSSGYKNYTINGNDTNSLFPINSITSTPQQNSQEATNWNAFLSSAAGTRILIMKDQALAGSNDVDGALNGIWKLAIDTSVTPNVKYLQRVEDMDEAAFTALGGNNASPGPFVGASVYVNNGYWKNDAFVCIQDPTPAFTTGSSQVWTQFAGNDSLNFKSHLVEIDTDGSAKFKAVTIKSSNTNQNGYNLFESTNNMAIDFVSRDGSNNSTHNNFTVSSGTVTFSKTPQFQSCHCNSDEKLKKDIQVIEGKEALDTLSSIRAVDWAWKSDNTKSSGIIAQDLVKVPALRHLVHESNGTLSVNYNGLHGFLVSSIQELTRQVKELKQ